MSFNVFSNLDLKGQGRGIIIGVTRLLLLGPFYTIQIKFYMFFFAHDCTVPVDLMTEANTIIENQLQPKLVLFVKICTLLISKETKLFNNFKFRNHLTVSKIYVLRHQRNYQVGYNYATCIAAHFNSYIDLPKRLSDFS